MLFCYDKKRRHSKKEKIACRIFAKKWVLTGSPARFKCATDCANTQSPPNEIVAQDRLAASEVAPALDKIALPPVHSKSPTVSPFARCSVPFARKKIRLKNLTIGVTIPVANSNSLTTEKTQIKPPTIKVEITALYVLSYKGFSGFS